MMQAEQAKLDQRAIGSLRPYAGNARTHSKKQVKQIADSITRFGFTNPVLISDDGEIIAGTEGCLLPNYWGKRRRPCCDCRISARPNGEPMFWLTTS